MLQKNSDIEKLYGYGGGGNVTPSVINFLFHSAGKVRRAPLWCVTSFEYDNSLCLKELCHDFLSVFLFCSTEKLGRETFCMCFKKLQVVKRLRIREGGVSRYSVEMFLSDSAKKFLGRTLPCFRNFWLLNNFCLRG